MRCCARRNSRSRRQEQTAGVSENMFFLPTAERGLMTFNGWLQILFFFAIILLVTKPLGIFMAHVFNREKTFLDPLLRPIERLVYKLTRVNETREMRWTEYAVTMLLFSIVSMLLLYLIQRLQGHLPFNPQHLAG